jgi:thiamine biosynthesis lipoprotein
VTTAGCARTISVMGTCATIEVFPARSDQTGAVGGAIDRALGWFRHIEQICSRFDPVSELARLTHRIGEPVQVSRLLYEAVEFGVAIAEETAGAFDPTVGIDMERRGFDREYRTGHSIRTDAPGSSSASYRDITLDRERRSITLHRALMLDLGAIVKGLAVDLAARELARFEDFVIDAGGDLFVAGRRPDGAPWKIGIRHPRRDGALIDAVLVSGVAVCTSGDYERRIGDDGPHHIVDGRTRTDAALLASATVIAPSAMVADGLATAAFVLGPKDGIRLLERQGVEGLLITPALERHATRGFPSDSSILQDAQGPSDGHPLSIDGHRHPDRGTRADLGCPD